MGSPPAVCTLNIPASVMSLVILFPLLTSSIRDETRTSYLLQGVESAWDSVGRRKPQSQTQHHFPIAPANQGVAYGAASLSGFKLHEEQEPREESLRGAEALVDVPQKGNNVSSIIIKTSLVT